MTTGNIEYTEARPVKKRRKAVNAGVALVGAGLAVGLVGATVASWTEEVALGQQFSSGEDIFDVEISIDGGETWVRSTSVEADEEGDGGEINGDAVVDFAHLQFDGNTREDGTPLFAPGDSQSAELLVRALGNTEDTVVVFVSDVGYEGNADVFAWEIAESITNDAGDVGDRNVIAASDSLADFSVEDNGAAEIGVGETLSLDINIEASTDYTGTGSTTGYWVITADEQIAHDHVRG